LALLRRRQQRLETSRPPSSPHPAGAESSGPDPTEAEIDQKRQNPIATGIIGKRSAVIPITDAMAVMAAKKAGETNIRTELSGIAELDLYLSMQSNLRLTKKDVVVVVNTGWDARRLMIC
jgi:hypothetical protein